MAFQFTLLIIITLHVRFVTDGNTAITLKHLGGAYRNKSESAGITAVILEWPSGMDLLSRWKSLSFFILKPMCQKLMGMSSHNVVSARNNKQRRFVCQDEMVLVQQGQDGEMGRVVELRAAMAPVVVSGTVAQVGAPPRSQSRLLLYLAPL
jgi:hypothetical protein